MKTFITFWWKFNVNDDRTVSNLTHGTKQMADIGSFSISVTSLWALLVWSVDAFLLLVWVGVTSGTICGISILFWTLEMNGSMFVTCYLISLLFVIVIIILKSINSIVVVIISIVIITVIKRSNIINVHSIISSTTMSII